MKLKWLGLLGNLILLAGGLAFTISFLRIVDQMHSVVKNAEQTITSMHGAEELENVILQHNRVRLLWATTHDSLYKEDIESYEKEIEQWLTLLQKFASETAEDRRVFSDAKAAIESYLSEWRRLEEAKIAPTDIFRMTAASLQTACRSVDLISEMVQQHERQLQNEADEEHTISHFVAYMTGGMLLLMMLGVFETLRRVVLKPLAQLQTSTQRFGAGDWDCRVALSGLQEIKAMGYVFNEMADGLKKHRNQQVRILASIAHDVRNPLAGIKMSAEMLLSDKDSNPETQTQMINIISRQATRLDRIVGDLLDVSRIEAGQMELQISRQDLNELILDTAKIFQAASSTHTILTKVPEEPLFYKCDADRMSQVLNNLVSNAIKYSPFGGPVKIELKVISEFASIEVIDEGIGIAANEQQRIFQPFWRSSATRDTIPGVGLGLASTKRIVENHGGRIEVESMVTKGAIFRVLLPMHDHSRPDI